MKRNWLPYVAVAAALVAGSICSTALAGGPGGFKFGGNGGSSIRMGGSNNSGGNNSSSRNFQPRVSNLNGIGQAISGNSNNNMPRVTIKPGGNLGQAIGGGSNNAAPRIGIHPGVVNQIKKNGNISGIPGIVGNGNGVPKIGKIDQGFNKGGNGNIGQAIGNAILGGGNGNGNHHHGQNNIHCGPVKVGCKPWWNDCHHFHHNHCYKPTYPVCSHPIVVQVPVVVEQVAVAQPAMQVPVGATLTLQALGLGNEAGQVMLQVDKIAIPAMVNEWTDGAVTTTLPMLGLASPVIADIVMVRADGTVANSIKVELVNAQPEAQAAAPAGAVQQAAFQADQGGAAAALGGLSQ